MVRKWPTLHACAGWRSANNSVYKSALRTVLWTVRSAVRSRVRPDPTTGTSVDHRWTHTSGHRTGVVEKIFYVFRPIATSWTRIKVAIIHCHCPSVHTSVTLSRKRTVLKLLNIYDNKSDVLGKLTYSVMRLIKELKIPMQGGCSLQTLILREVTHLRENALCQLIGNIHSRGSTQRWINARAPWSKARASSSIRRLPLMEVLTKKIL